MSYENKGSAFASPRISYGGALTDDKLNEQLEGVLGYKDGRILGGLVEVSPHVATIAAPIINRVALEISTRGAPFAGKMGKTISGLLGYSEQATQRAERVSTQAFRYGFIVAEDIANIASTVKAHGAEITKLAAELAPVTQANQAAKSGFTSVMTSGNEVVGNARKRVLKQMVAGFGADAVSFVGRLPNLLATYYSDQRIEKEKGFEAEAALLQDPTADLHAGSTEEEIKRAAERANTRVDAPKPLHELGHAELHEKVTGFQKQHGFKDYDAAATAFSRVYSQQQKDAAAAAGTIEHLQQKWKKTEADFADKEQALGTYVGPGAAIVAQILKEKGLVKGGKKLGQVIAHDMILNLSKQLEENPGAQEVYDMEGRSTMPIRVAVEAIFQQHEKDCGRPALGRKALQDLQPASTMIAEVIAAGEMDAMALVNMVGDKLIIGRGQKVAKGKQLEDVIAKQSDILPKGGAVNVEAVMKETPLELEDLSQILKTLKGEERGIFAMLWPTKVLMAAGLSRGEVERAKHIGKEIYAEHVADMVVTLANTPEEELKTAGFLEDDIPLIRQLARKAQRHGIEAIQEEGTQILRKADKGFWTDRLAKDEPTPRGAEAILNQGSGAGAVSMTEREAMRRMQAGRQGQGPEVN